MAKNSTQTTLENFNVISLNDKKKNLVLALPITNTSFRDAWLAYAGQPSNADKSNSSLLRNIVAEAIGFDLSTIVVKERGKADTDGKLLNALIKRAKEESNKRSAIDAMAMQLIASGVDISDMFPPEEIKKYKEWNASGGTKPAL